MRCDDRCILEVRLRPLRLAKLMEIGKLATFNELLGPFSLVEEVSLDKTTSDVVLNVRFSDETMVEFAQSVLDGARLNDSAVLSARPVATHSPDSPATASDRVLDNFRSEANCLRKSTSINDNFADSVLIKSDPTYSAGFRHLSSYQHPDPSKQDTAPSTQAPLSLSGDGATHTIEPFNQVDNSWGMGMNLVPVVRIGDAFGETASQSKSAVGALRKSEPANLSLPTQKDLRRSHNKTVSCHDPFSVFESAFQVANFFELMGPLIAVSFSPNQKLAHAEFAQPDVLPRNWNHPLLAASAKLGLTLKTAPFASLRADHQTSSRPHTQIVCFDSTSPSRRPWQGPLASIGLLLVVWLTGGRLCSSSARTLNLILMDAVARASGPRVTRQVPIKGRSGVALQVEYSEIEDSVFAYIRLNGSSVGTFTLHAEFWQPE